MILNCYNNLKEFGVHLLKLSKNDKPTIEKVFGNKDVDTFTLSYSFRHYLDIVLLTRRYKNVSNFLYIVHTNNVVPFNNRLFARFIYNKLFSNLLKKMIDSNLLFFMDDMCVTAFNKLYNIEIDLESQIIFLPYQINKFPLENEDYTKKEKFRILTISRADFPFKGYIFGLIEQFTELKKMYPYLYLSIIAFGAEVHKIIDTIQWLDEEIKKSIEFIGRVPYDSLSNYIKETDLYVGMGTTVLDAANYFIPALVVKSYTYDCLTSGYFSENPLRVGAIGENLLSAKVYIESFLKKSENEILELRKNSFLALSDNYDIDMFAYKFFKLKNNCQSLKLSLYDKFAMRLFAFIYNLRTRRNKA